MALMKMGRRGVNPGEDPKKKKGEDPKKKAAAQEVTVSAKKPERKDQKVQLEGATTSNIFYADIKDENERNKAAQKYENASYDKAMKAGNMVSLSAIKTSNPKAYTLLSNAVQSKKDSYGEVEDYIVDKKYANVSSYEELGFPKGYDPEERKKAVKADKLDAYEKKMGGKSQFVAGGNFGYYTKYMTDEKLKEKIDKDPVRLPIKSASITQKVGKLKEAPEKEEATWSEPSGATRMKKKVQSSSTRQGPNGEVKLNRAKDVAKFVGASIKTIGNKYAIKPGLVETPVEKKFQIKKKIEERQFKSLYGQPSSLSGNRLSGMTLGELAEEKKSLKSALKDKEFKGSSAFTRSEMRNERRGIRKDIRATNLASKYTSKNLTPTSVFDKNGVERVEMQPKVNAAAKHYKAEMGDRYTKYTREQKDNAVNRNTLESQSNALKPKRSRKSSNKLKN
jgi:hypothetical protein